MVKCTKTHLADGLRPVVKVRGGSGGSAPCSHEPPAKMSPLCLNNAKLVGLEWVWGLLQPQPGFVR